MNDPNTVANPNTVTDPNTEAPGAPRPPPDRSPCAASTSARADR